MTWEEFLVWLRGYAMREMDKIEASRYAPQCVVCGSRQVCKVCREIEGK